MSTRYRPGFRLAQQAVLDLIEKTGSTLAWKLHFLLPTMLLGPRSTQCGIGMGARLTAFAERRWGDLLLHLPWSAAGPRRHSSEKMERERREGLAARLVSKGQVSRAYTALTSTARPTNSAASKKALERKHPARSREIPVEVVEETRRNAGGHTSDDLLSVSAVRASLLKAKPG